MQSNDEVTSAHQKLISRIDDTVARSNEEMDRAKLSLGEIAQFLDQAADKLLSAVERLLDSDYESGDHWEAIGRACQGGEGHAAYQSLIKAREAQVATINDMMADLSFHDLTGQGLEGVKKTLSKVQNLLEGLIGAESDEGEDQPSSVRAASMSGVERLKEQEADSSRQALIDELLRR